MSEMFLDKIIDTTRERVKVLKAATDVGKLCSKATEIRSLRPLNSLHAALSKTHQTNIIAEIKRASPSRGIINDHVDVGQQAQNYKIGGACAISVLTEETYFKGSIDDLKTARAAVDLPLLRKDFTIDEFQIYEAAAAGADAILLIVAALTSENLLDFQTLAHELGMDAIVEVHTAEEIEIAAQVDAPIVGVNNRDLKTFDVTLDISRRLINHRPKNALMIAESGISSREQIRELKDLGFDGFLVGESLMRTANSKYMLEALI